MNYCHQILKKLSDLNLFFWSTLWLMVLLTIGTIEQKNIGLFLSQEKYFSSLYFLYKGIPLPGGGAVIILMSLGLLSQLLYKTSFKNPKKIGIMLTHVGALVLLIGSMVTNKLAQEGSVVIAEGETVSELQDYKQFEVVLKSVVIPEKFLGKFDLVQDNQGLQLSLSEDVKISLQKIYPNCQLVQNTENNQQLRGFATQFAFSELPLAAENTLCLQFSLNSKKGTETYRVYQGMPKAQTVIIGDQQYTVEIRNKHYPLPFSIKLINFEKKFHQGTMISRSFKSEVILIDGDMQSRRIIEMNSPLRYKGYTFYQSSFSENSNGEISEFSVVKNIGQALPYISSVIICIGILLHLLINSNFLWQKGKNEKTNFNMAKPDFVHALVGFFKRV